MPKPRDGPDRTAALLPLALCLASTASWALAEAPAAGGRTSSPLRYRFRRGESWRERVSFELKLRELGAGGEPRESWRFESTELVEVVSVGRDGWARLRRTPLAEGAGGEEMRTDVPPEPFEVLVSPRGRVRFPEPGPSERGPGAGRRVHASGKEVDPEEAAHRRALVEAAFARLAPVLPEGPLAEGGSARRTIRSPLPGGGFAETETAGLAPADGEPQEGSSRRPGVVTLRIRRGAGPDAGSFELRALVAPPGGALRAVPLPSRIRGVVTGSSGEGEIRIDAAAGRLLGCRMEETIAIEAALGRVTVAYTVTVRAAVERLDGERRAAFTAGTPGR
jgi:hypothetical protein